VDATKAETWAAAVVAVISVNKLRNKRLKVVISRSQLHHSKAVTSNQRNKMRRSHHRLKSLILILMMIFRFKELLQRSK
jgi:hypothetical protein